MDELWAWIGTRTNWRPDTHQPDDDDDDDGDDDDDVDDDGDEADDDEDSNIDATYQQRHFLEATPVSCSF